MKEKLKELLIKADENAAGKMVMDYKDAVDDIADYLLANGVIVPPCKVGAKVAVVTSQTSNGRNNYIFEDTITHYRICDGVTIMCFDNHLGVPHWSWDNVFLSREEAEAALKGADDGKAD